MNDVSKNILDGPGYEKFDSLLGKRVKVFCNNGSILTGIVTDRQGKYVDLFAEDAKRGAFLNLDHISSMNYLS